MPVTNNRGIGESYLAETRKHIPEVPYGDPTSLLRALAFLTPRIDDIAFSEGSESRRGDIYLQIGGKYYAKGEVETRVN